VQYTETEFYLLQREAEQRWWLALVLALCVHGAAIAVIALIPTLFANKPIVEEVVSVSLVTMPDTGGAPASPAAADPPSRPPTEVVEPPTPPKAPPETAAPPEQPPPAPKEKVVIQPDVRPPEPAQLKNPISLAPDKRKIKKSQDTRLEEEKFKERDLVAKKIEELKREAERKEAQRREEERQKALAKARSEQIKAEKELQNALAEARALTADLNAVRADANRRTQAVQNAMSGSGPSSRQQAQSIVEQNYWSAVAQRVKSFWALPEMRRWDENLLAKVVITINKNGEITRIQFDQRSIDPLYDQLVEKTIRSAAPMPPFPTLMQQETTVLGLNFKPGELGNM